MPLLVRQSIVIEVGDMEKMELPSFVWIDCLGESRESHEIRLDVVIILGDY